MNKTVQLFLLFQLLPVCFLGMGVLQVATDMTVSYQFFGEKTAINMTNWERNPQNTITQFWQTMEFAIFAFFVGLPFELILFSFDRQDRLKERDCIKNKV